MLRDGNTHCHGHSTAALGYFRSSANGNHTPARPTRRSSSNHTRTVSRCSRTGVATLTATERAKAASRPHTTAGTLAKRFAAKEAFSKAVGTGFKRGVFMKDIGVVNAPSGAPTLQLTGGAAARLDALAPAGHAIDIHLTMTDDYPWAQAFVILSARKMES